MWSWILVKQALDPRNVASRAVDTVMKLRAKVFRPNVRATGIAKIPKMPGEEGLSNLADYEAFQKSFQNVQPYKAVQSLGRMMNNAPAGNPALEEVRKFVSQRRRAMAGPRAPMIL